MTNREQEILELIKKDPLISQNEIAEILGITRSSVAVHITNLLKKGYLLGKGYIVRPDVYVAVVGGTNMDIQGIPKSTLIPKDSNIGEVHISPGGVGRNIAENLVRLGIDTKLITVLGDDLYGSKIIEEAKILGLHMQDSLILQGEATSTYLSVLDESHDMAVAIAHMGIMDRMTVDFMKGKKHVIENAKVCVIDTNLPQEVIEYIVTTYKNTDFILDPVSTSKAKKVKDIIGYFHTIKPNKLEAEILTGISINTNEDLHRVADCLLQQGVKRVFISLGSEGVFYSDGTFRELLSPPKVQIVNATGAGDAFVAALTYGYMKDYSIAECARFAMAASIIALSHKNTINPNMSYETIKIKMKELGLC